MVGKGRTTYIFGAGASLHAGYPSVKTMGSELLEWMRVPREHPYDFAFSAGYLEDRFGNGIEALFEGVERSIRKHEFDRSLIANVHKPALVQAVREWFGEIHQRNQAHSYEVFASKIVQPGDCVITFNYDVSLDSNLRRAGKWAVGDGYGFKAEGLPQGSTVELLKLHGSMNWLAVMFGGITSGGFRLPAEGVFGSRPAIPDGDLSALGYVNVVDPLWPQNGTTAQPPMILPTSRKRFYFDTNLGREWGSLWDRLWRSARTAIRTSDRIVVCGYGLFPIDRRGCNLLLKGELSGEIEICSWSDTDRIVSDLRAHGRKAKAAEQRSFVDWVQIKAEI